MMPPGAGTGGNPATSSLRWLIFGTLALAIAGLMGLMGWALATKAPITGRSGMMRVGLPAPDFSVQLFDGSEISLSELKGSPLLINFWASWCPPCRQESRTLERTWQAYREGGVMFVGLNVQDTVEDAAAYVREFDLTFPNGRDVDGKITVEYGVVGLPVTFFVNREGTVERRWVGAISQERLVEWLDDLVAGVPPSGETEGGDTDSYLRLD